MSTSSDLSAPDATTVAVYDRVIRASITRIWENVLDWEHLPWLHAGSFASIELQHADEGGWKASVEVGPRGFSSPAEVEVVLDRPNSCYTTSTLSGVGAGTKIVTTLDPVEPHATAIKVEFIVPGVAAEDADAVGEIYLDLYRQLWDEDEVMMRHRQEFLDGLGADSSATADAASELVLGDEEAVRSRLPLTTKLAGRAVRVVDVDGELVAHDVVCPHIGGPLEQADVEDGTVVCPWHGYRFDLRTGEGRAGCKLRLAAAPRVEVDSVSRVVRLSAD